MQRISANRKSSSAERAWQSRKLNCRLFKIAISNRSNSKLTASLPRWTWNQSAPSATSSKQNDFLTSHSGRTLVLSRNRLLTTPWSQRKYRIPSPAIRASRTSIMRIIIAASEETAALQTWRQSDLVARKVAASGELIRYRRPWLTKMTTCTRRAWNDGIWASKVMRTHSKL